MKFIISMMMKYNKIQIGLGFLLILIGIICAGCTVQAESTCEGYELDDLLTMAAQGDVDAQFNLGFCYTEHHHKISFVTL